MTNQATNAKTPGNKALRIGRRSLKGRYYLLTTATFDSKLVFKSHEAVRIVIESLQWLDHEAFIGLDTYVVMPDHLHFIAELLESNLPDIMKKLKGYTARKINSISEDFGPLWQPGYHDHGIRKDECLNDIRQYCLQNPVRAGIVKDYRDYPYWSCRMLTSVQIDGGEL